MIDFDKYYSTSVVEISNIPDEVGEDSLRKWMSPHQPISFGVHFIMTGRTSRRIFAEFATDEAANKMIKDNSLDNYGDHPVSRAKITHNAMTASLFSSSKRNFSYITKFKTLFSGQSKPKNYIDILRHIISLIVKVPWFSSIGIPDDQDKNKLFLIARDALSNAPDTGDAELVHQLRRLEAVVSNCPGFSATQKSTGKKILDKKIGVGVKRLASDMESNQSEDGTSSLVLTPSAVSQSVDDVQSVASTAGDLDDDRSINWKQKYLEAKKANKVLEMEIRMLRDALAKFVQDDA